MTLLPPTLRVALMLLVAIGPVAPSLTLAAERGRLIRTEQGLCLEGPHELGRTRRTTGQAATSDKPRDPSEDDYIHCREASDAGGPIIDRGFGR